MRLIFTRHGESEANLLQIISNRDLPHPLTAKGRAQTQALAERLAGLNVLAIYASPILRAQQTAAIVAERLGIDVQTANALREFDCGVMEGCGDEAAWRAHRAVSEAWVAGEADQRIKGGESLHDLRVRFVPFVQQVVQQFRGDDGEIVLITHGGLLYQMLPLVLANVDHAFVRQHSLANCACVFVELQGDQLVCVDWDTA